MFNEEKGFIGFFGTQGSDRIYQLGFIVQDLTCSEEAVSGGTGDRVFDASFKEEDVDNSGFWIVSSIFGGVILLFAIIWLCICLRKKSPAG